MRTTRHDEGASIAIDGVVGDPTAQQSDRKPDQETKPPGIYLRQLTVHNFRRLKDAEVALEPGLTVVVGENNAGKTAIVDALRSLLGYYAVTRDDLAVSGTPPMRAAEYDIAGVFSGLTIDDEARLVDALIPLEGRFDARLAIRGRLRGDDVFTDAFVGSTATGNSRDIRSQMRLVYLPPLRDPDSAYGLRPGRSSQIAGLLRRITSDAEQTELEELARNANSQLQAKPPIERARKQISDNLLELSGADYVQEVGLAFTEPEFQQLAASLEAHADGMNIALNGLGYSNLYYIAAVLGDLKADKSIRYRLLIIEEPEAHLHPHFQVLLLRFLRDVATGSNPVQVLVTTHSPILASRAATASLTPIRSAAGRIHACPVTRNHNSAEAQRVRQYLDATRSELFFARRLLLVEGDAELLGLPSLARVVGLNFDDAGVSVVSAAGLNFDIFIPFVRSDVLGIPVAILTDGDRPMGEKQDSPSSSAYVKKLTGLIQDDMKVRLFYNTVTFEHELAREPKNRPLLLVALGNTVGPGTFKKISDALSTATDEKYADVFLAEVFGKRKTSKARFAQELALLLDATAAPSFIVPQYIQDALDHLRKA